MTSGMVCGIARIGLVVLATGPVAAPALAASVIDQRGKNGQQFTFVCPAGGYPLGSVWGTGVYTDDSEVCTAAVHDGRIDPNQGGTVTVEIRPGQDAYQGTLQHGLSTSSYGGWHGSYVFVSATPIANRPPIAPATLAPANTYEQVLSIDPYAPLAQLTWQVSPDPDGDRVLSWLDLWRWNGASQEWEWLGGEYVDGTAFAVVPPDLQYNSYYAWRVFAVDPDQRSTQWYTPSGWSVFLTGPGPAGDDGWIIEIDW